MKKRVIEESEEESEMESEDESEESEQEEESEAEEDSDDDEYGYESDAGRRENARDGDGDEDASEEEKESTDFELDVVCSPREENAAAVASGSVRVELASIMPGIIAIPPPEQLLRRAFKPPGGGPAGMSAALRARLSGMKRFVPYGQQGPPRRPSLPPPLPEAEAEEEKKEEEDLSTVAPLVLRVADPEQGVEGIEVDLMLCKFLRPHQRAGTQFLFDCVTGAKRECADNMGDGCILADDMGLGKTLQGITLVWTLLQSKIARRCIIVCPTSLVANWDGELDKWLQGKCRTLPLIETSKQEAISSIANFLSPGTMYQVLIVSYETFRIHANRFKKAGSCDLLICDEAHRLKNAETETSKTLNMLPCSRRVLLSGTPMQNHLDEFYAMVSFCNPGVLGTRGEFRRKFENPILASREPDATSSERKKGNERQTELSAIVNNFILRRTNALLSAHLPPKVVEVVCCRMTPLQTGLYKAFLSSKLAKKAVTSGKNQKVLAAITLLKKLSNHPKLIHDMIMANYTGKEKDGLDGFADALYLFDEHTVREGNKGRVKFVRGWENLSGKMAVLARMLAKLRKETKDRIVIVSNYGQTLDLLVTLCKESNYPHVRLDGATSHKKRQELVKKFNDPAQDQFVFLLSSKAGGCGLNLVGGNRLVLFDPDWNPANDKQAAARVWRDGQTKRVFEYRFLASGTIEERIYQRQLAKEGLQTVVDDDGSDKSKNLTNLMSADQLRELFMYDEQEISSTHSSLKCKRCKEGSGGCKQVGKPDGGQLKLWAHHVGVQGLPDRIMAECGGSDVSFIFSNRVDGKKLDHDPEAEKEGDVLSQIPESQREVQADSFLEDGSTSEGTSAPCDVDNGSPEERSNDQDASSDEDVIVVESESDEDEDEDDDDEEEVGAAALPMRSKRGNGKRKVISDSEDDEENLDPVMRGTLRTIDINTKTGDLLYGKRGREVDKRAATTKRPAREVVSDSDISDIDFTE